MTFGNYAYLHLSVAFISILKASGLGSHQECKHRVLLHSLQCARGAWACLHLWVAFLSIPMLLVLGRAKSVCGTACQQRVLYSR